ncbi:hypothetical protein, partial [Escherichia coli]|uniref:hypothetical protein n=1 Tax=Escherichia coli TaxID=562 RepID=UPI00195C616C
SAMMNFKSTRESGCSSCCMSAISEYGIEPANQVIKNRIDAAMVCLDILRNEQASSSVRLWLVIA